MATIIFADGFFDITTSDLADAVIIDGHGCADVAIYNGGRPSIPGSQTDSLQKIRFDDSVAVATSTTTMVENRRHHCSTSDGTNIYIAQGRGSGGYRQAVEKFQISSEASVTITNNNLTSARTGLMGTGTSTEQYFFGGREAGSGMFTVINAPDRLRNDDSAAATTYPSFTVARWHHTVAGNGEDAFVCQGWSDEARDGIIAGAATASYEKYRMAGSSSTAIFVSSMDSYLTARNDVNGASGGNCIVLVGGEEPDYSANWNQIRKLRYDDYVLTLSITLATATKEVQTCSNGDVIMGAGGHDLLGDGDAISRINHIRHEDMIEIITTSNSLASNSTEGAVSSGI